MKRLRLIVVWAMIAMNKLSSCQAVSQDTSRRTHWNWSFWNGWKLLKRKLVRIVKWLTFRSLMMELYWRSSSIWLLFHLLDKHPERIAATATLTTVPTLEAASLITAKAMKQAPKQITCKESNQRFNTKKLSCLISTYINW